MSATSSTIAVAASVTLVGIALAFPPSAEVLSQSGSAAAGATATTAGAPLEPFVQKVSGTVLEFAMAPVPGGRVTAAIDGATHTADVAPFWIATTETTWDLYDVFVFELDKAAQTSADSPDAITRPSKPYVSPDRGYGHGGYAAISLSHKSAAQFCRWLSAKTGRTYTLPTEAEWRQACARSAIAPDAIDDHAWHEGNADFTPHPVATKKPDALGLYDLYGNVREWCTSFDGAPIALGGSFIDEKNAVGCDARAIPTPEWQMTDPQVPKSVWWLSDADFVGFRIVCRPGGSAAGGTQ